jgi:hypothetical protein
MRRSSWIVIGRPISIRWRLRYLLVNGNPELILRVVPAKLSVSCPAGGARQSKLPHRLNI